jgi:hypothetical protein
MIKYQTVEEYIEKQEEWKSKILIDLRKIIKKSAPKSKESIKWSQPVYEDNIGPFCFLRAHKDHVNIGFWWGSKLKDKNNILEGEGEKMRHIKIFQKTKIDEKEISLFIEQSLNLNIEFGNPSR